MKKILAFIVVCLIALPAMAADIYVGPSSAGSADGSSFGNQYAWSSVSFVRGNTYLLNTGTYGAKTLSTAPSGTSYVYIKNGGMGVCTFTGGLTITSSYWDIDGVAGGGPGSWITGHGIVFTSAACASINYIHIGDDLNQSLTNINVRRVKFTQTGNTEACDAGDSSIYNAYSVSDSIFERLYFDNIGGLPFLLRGGSGNFIQYNYIGNICGGYEYDQPNNHCEALVLHDMDDLHFRWNYLSECPSTGGFVKNNADVTANLIRIYGNVFRHSTGDVGGKAISVNGPATNWVVANNTVYDAAASWLEDGTGTAFSSGDNSAYNNILVRAGGTAFAAAITHDYQWYSSTTVQCSMGEGAHENICDQCLTGCDSVEEISNPFVNSTGTSPEGFYLSSPLLSWDGYDTGSILPGNDTDMDGETRGADGVWDRGAYEYQTPTTTTRHRLQTGGKRLSVGGIELEITQVE